MHTQFSFVARRRIEVGSRIPTCSGAYGAPSVSWITWKSPLQNYGMRDYVFVTRVKRHLSGHGGSPSSYLAGPSQNKLLLSMLFQNHIGFDRLRPHRATKEKCGDGRALLYTLIN